MADNPLLLKAQSMGIKPAGAPQPAGSLLQKAQQLGMKPGITTPSPKPPAQDNSLLGKISSGVGKVLDPLSQGTFGTFGKTTGGLITQGIASGAQLYGQVTGNKGATQFGQKLEKGLGPQGFQPTAKDVAFQTLELYPGGEGISKYLKDLPGGEFIAKHIAELPDALKKNAIEQYSKVFGATSKESKALVKETVPGLLDKGISFKNAGDLATKAEGKATEFGGKIDEFFKALPKTAKESTKPILDKIAAFRDKFIVDGKILRPEAVQAANNTMEKIAQFGKDIGTESARKVRQIFDEHFDVSKGIEDLSTYTKKAERAGADAIRAEFAKTRPELAKLNGEFNFWKNVQDLGTYTAEKAKGKLTKGLASVTGAALGFEAGQGLGQKAEYTAIGAWLGSKAIDMFRSPGWQTLSAVQKSKLADAIMKSDTKTIELITSKVLGTGQNVITGALSPSK